MNWPRPYYIRVKFSLGRFNPGIIWTEVYSGQLYLYALQYALPRFRDETRLTKLTIQFNFVILHYISVSQSTFCCTCQTLWLYFSNDYIRLGVYFVFLLEIWLSQQIS